MLEELLPYYERELGYLREMAGEFALRYPKIGRRLQIDGEQCEDPHVERLIESFAFLTARIHRKLDDEYPEITEAFIQVLYPHYLRPIPSATIVQISTDPDKPELSGRYTIPRHHPVVAPIIQGVKCQFRTCYDLDLWPIALNRAGLELAQNSAHLRTLTTAAAVINLELNTLSNLNFETLKLDKLRFFLDGNAPLMHLLYELIFSKLIGIRVTDGSDDPSHTVILPKEALRPVGFSPEEGLLDFDTRSFPGYRLLTEYFAFPDKFMFFEVTGLDHPKLRHPGSRLKIQLLLSHYAETERHTRLLQTLNAQNFKLGCVPLVNLFQQAGDPIRITNQQSTYPVTVNGRKVGGFEVYSIDAVTRVEKGFGEEIHQEVPPFYSINHFSTEREQSYYWYATREASTRRDDRGTDVELALVDLDFKPVRPESEVLSLELTCTNRDLPASIPFGGAGNTGEGFTVPNHGIVKRVALLRKPTPSLRMPAKAGLQWRLISHLSINQLSMVAHGKEALQEILGLYNYTDSPAMAKQIQGIVSVETKPTTARLPGPGFVSFARGLEVTMTFDENGYVGSNLFLFASILERFLAYFCAPNSFVKFHMFTRQQEDEVHHWPARAGETALI
ncbi:type VI secretion system baseplate subunit TssF [Holophaga foetida]|uniref:type VI secretion system baseplate subunit TssF n=1 Tax=Holophaga foetida TaxID=35839 RepID=UPI0002472A6C|nr:type VI secretion system baseplate subunit TssF [Holophaga foetida]